MRARGRIEAAVSQNQPLDRAAMHQMLSDDLIHIFRLYKAVPYGFRVNDYSRAMLALVEASSLVGAGGIFQARGLHLVLEQPVQLALAVVGA